MMFKKIAIITLMTLVLRTAEASPINTGVQTSSQFQVGDTITEAGESLVVAQVVPYDNGTLTYWVDAPRAGSKAVRDLVPRACGTDDVVCSGSHQADFWTCYDLIQVLGNDGNTILPKSPRAVCYSGTGLCCISWSSAQLGIRKAYLIYAANKILNYCSNGNPLLSGLARNVNLNGNCMTQCLSNRATGCT